MAEEDPIIREWAVTALKGDQDAFRLLVERYQNNVYNLAYRLLGESQEAEDAAQEAFLRAYANLARYDPARSFKTWLLSITSNHCIDRLRKRRLTLISVEDEMTVPHPALNSRELTPEDSFLMNERSEEMQAFLAQISPDYRTAIILRYWHDMSYAEIAETLHTSESAIKSRLFRARQALAQVVKTDTEPTNHLGANPAMKPAMERS